ncbi:2-dehydro-3-deoxygalactonokinase [Pseudooceanicola sp. HF7]|nr:2-dehydro-3-deoxygalactonokinase [Pseudooceanicola sp. HF7]
MLTATCRLSYSGAMDWLGLEIEGERCWDADGPCEMRTLPTDRRFVVGHEGVPPEPLPGRLLPEQLQRSRTGLHLPGLGGVPSGARLRLLGFQTLNPNWDGLALVVCDQTTLWVTLSAGEAIHLQTSLTGRIAGALGCLEAAPEGTDESMSSAERLPFLLGEAETPGQMLGAMLGGEMAAAKNLWLGQQAVLLGQGHLAQAYLKALQGLYVPVTETRDDLLAREGFKALAKSFLVSG